MYTNFNFESFDRSTPPKKMFILILMLIVVVFLNLVKGGGGGFKSPIGIECGSFSYWAVTSSIFVWLLLVSYYVRNMLIENWRLKQRLKYVYQEGDIEWNERNTLIYPTICILAGFCAGMFGIGGGKILILSLQSR